MIQVTDALAIDERDLEERFVLASGPGGQNVNKVATAVQLRFDLARTSALPEAVRARLAKLAGRRLTADGILVIEAKRYRSQERNRADALDRLIQLIACAAEPPKPRRPTRPSAASKRRQLESKRRRSRLKKQRAGAIEADG